MHLTITLLGRFAVSLDGAPVELATRKAAAVLAVLAHAGGRPVARERLAAMLWPRADEAQARGSLRQAVAQIRRALGHADTDAIVNRLETEREPVAAFAQFHER